METVKFIKDDESPTTDQVASQPLNDLLCCPFCGGDATIIFDANEHNFQIVGCSNRITMLCPSPRITVYKDKDGNYDYQWWNNRAI